MSQPELTEYERGWHDCLEELLIKCAEEIRNSTDGCRIRALQYVIAAIKEFE